MLEISQKTAYHLHLPNTYCIYIDNSPETELEITHMKMVCGRVGVEWQEFINFNKGLFVLFNTEEEMREFWEEYCEDEILCPYALMFAPYVYVQRKYPTYNVDELDKKNGLIINENT